MWYIYIVYLLCQYWMNVTQFVLFWKWNHEQNHLLFDRKYSLAIGGWICWWFCSLVDEIPSNLRSTKRDIWDSHSLRSWLVMNWCVHVFFCLFFLDFLEPQRIYTCIYYLLVLFWCDLVVCSVLCIQVPVPLQCWPHWQVSPATSWIAKSTALVFLCFAFSASCASLESRHYAKVCPWKH